MAKSYLSYNNIFCPLGWDSPSVFQALLNDECSIKLLRDFGTEEYRFMGSRLNTKELEKNFELLGNGLGYTRMEMMMILSLNQIMSKIDLAIGHKTILIVSTTKGNIDVLQKNSKFDKKKAYLATLAKTIADFFNFKNEPIVVSNACVSGLLSINIAKRLINNGIYDHALIVSGDILSQFVMSGFGSFQALSTKPCKPYSINRSGISIGEAAASILVTQDKSLLSEDAVEVLGDASCNDANHISGPSRTGEGLYRAVKTAMNEAGINALDLNYISAHGTATNYNDEMEAIAFNRLNLHSIPLNSLKGYVGHTMGACGLLETIIGMQSLYNNKLVASKGFDELGVSMPLNVIKKSESNNMELFLKTSSGFGGSNTATIFKKISLT